MRPESAYAQRRRFARQQQRITAAGIMAERLVFSPVVPKSHHNRYFRRNDDLFSG
jgi:hypothetical protein